ncbi:MAG TPA: hypothetical protein VL485_18290 [Ktedonobacteraceae bacterium]|nr:hypothetical protein [Ktedonobacteraceae bacterium]
MIAFIALIGFVIALIIVGFIVNLYLYSRKALRVTPNEFEPKDAAEQQQDLHDILFR